MLKIGKKFLCTLLVVVMCLTAAPLHEGVGPDCLKLGLLAEATNNIKVGGTSYSTLQAAITAATEGDTITLGTNVTEDVTIDKKLTIDGRGNCYTGKMTLKKGDVIIKNINFIQGQVQKNIGSKMVIVLSRVVILMVRD